MLANPRKSKNKSKEYRLKKKSVKKSNPCSSVISVFKFLSIAVGGWTLYYHRYNFSWWRCVPSLRQEHKSKNETRITPMNTDWSFHGFIFLIIMS